MKSIVAVALGLLSLGCAVSPTGFAVAEGQGGSFSGQVQRVWEDGFQLQAGNRSLRVDSYDVCGDNTARNVAVGSQLTVTGEFEGGEFDAFLITRSDGTQVCQRRSDSQ